MFLTDTHCHLYEPEFDTDRDAVFARAVETGVGRFVLPAIDSASHRQLFALCRRHPDRCFPMMGLHPTSVNNNPRWREELDQVGQHLKNPPEGIAGFCALGEIGLDFYWSADFRSEQTEAFRRQCEWALEFGLPIAVHTRSAWPEMLAIVEEFRGSGLRGVFHAFGEDAATYERLRACGDFLFGIGGSSPAKTAVSPTPCAAWSPATSCSKPTAPTSPRHPTGASATNPLTLPIYAPRSPN